MNRAGRLFFLLGMLLLTTEASAQSYKEKLRQAGVMHGRYDFEGATAIYESLMKSSMDSSMRADIEERLVRSENGRNMLAFATTPELVTSRTFSKKDFFLYFSHIADKSWVKAPNAFIKEKPDEYGEAMIYMEEAGKVVFSAPDEAGKMTIFESHKVKEGLWSAPESVENCKSAGNEVYPLISESGREMYFSSDAFAGMGGYDLFVSRWDDHRKCWGVPENLGFPYSSTGDDFLFSNTHDGEYTVFASNRCCSSDSMTVYVLKFENSPVKKPVSSPQEAEAIARLESKAENGAEKHPGTAEKAESRDSAYYRALGRLDAVRGEITELMYRRERAGSEREAREIEDRMMDLQARAGRIADSVSSYELELLASGKRIDHSTQRSAADNTYAVKSSYIFGRHSFGTLNGVTVEEPVNDDAIYEFTTDGPSEIFTELPEGLIYQIQISVSAQKITAKKIKGLSPVFEIKQPSGKYLYTTGVFRTYKEASAALKKVRDTGFKDARTVAWKNGRSIAVSKAKTLENNSYSYLTATANTIHCNRLRPDTKRASENRCPLFVGILRLERRTPCSQSKCASQLRHIPKRIAKVMQFF